MYDKESRLREGIQKLLKIFVLKFIAALYISCVSLDTAPSGMASINSFQQNTDRDIVRRGEKLECKAEQLKRGGFKRNLKVLLLNPNDGEDHGHSVIIIGKKNTIPLRYFGVDNNADFQVWGELKDSDSAKRFLLKKNASGQITGVLNFYNDAGGLKLKVTDFTCKKDI